MFARVSAAPLALALLRAWSCAPADAASAAPPATSRPPLATSRPPPATSRLTPATSRPTPATTANFPATSRPTPATTANFPATTASAPAPPIQPDWIPYGPERLREMEQYSLRHYGDASHALAPRAIVLHFTATRTYQAAREIFVHNHPHRGELPGVCAHYAIDKDGTIYALVPPEVRCRHAIGLNDAAIGIEMVQEGGRSDRWADGEILARPAQVDAAVRLVRYLQRRYGIADENVLGHATANASPLFHDLEGWRNDHGDWAEASVRRFRAMLATGR